MQQMWLDAIYLLYVVWLMNTLALSEYSHIGFFSKQMGTDSCEWELRSIQAILNITHSSGSLDSDPHL